MQVLIYWMQCDITNHSPGQTIHVVRDNHSCSLVHVVLQGNINILPEVAGTLDGKEI